MHKEFAVHKLSPEGLSVATQIAQDFDSLLTELERVLPEGREFSIVRTKLEEASFFAKKAIAPFYAVQ